MTYRNVALIGKARSGKDSIATQLVRSYAFTRVAFADPLRKMALKVDPWVDAGAFPTGPATCRRLSELVQEWGWERAKTEYPEVRRLLQTMGQTVRDFEENFWLDVAIGKVDVADTWNLPVVVTDCRYPNEAAALRARGFLMVEVVRPDRQELSGGNSAHESETALDGFDPDRVIVNDGTLADLASQADTLAWA